MGLRIIKGVHPVPNQPSDHRQFPEISAEHNARLAAFKALGAIDAGMNEDQFKEHLQKVQKYLVDEFRVDLTSVIGYTGEQEFIRRFNLFSAKVNSDEERRRARTLILQTCEGFAARLPSGVRETAFEPDFQDLLARYVEEQARVASPEEAERLKRRFVRSVRLAVAWSWGVAASEFAMKGVRWVIIALLGDGACRAVYWAVFSIVRRL